MTRDVAEKTQILTQNAAKRKKEEINLEKENKEILEKQK